MTLHEVNQKGTFRHACSEFSKVNSNSVHLNLHEVNLVRYIFTCMG